jgi:2-iminobutanoate/2-iminopropanoate deaminase
MKSGKRGSRKQGKAIRTKEAPAPGGHYSQAISVGGHIYVSGSGPFDPKTHKAVGRNIETQTKQTLNNIRAILNAAGASISEVVKITVYLRNMKDFEGMDKVYSRFFPTKPPARTTVQVGLYGKERLLAVDAIAIKSKKA